MNRNTEDVGWIYHDPTPRIKPIKFDRPISNVPGLTNEKQKDPVPRRRYIMEHDSPYVVRAKMNGSQTLLSHLNNLKEKQPPKPYRRCSWYYLKDNEIELNKLNSNDSVGNKHVFSVPPYMCDFEHINNSNKCSCFLGGHKKPRPSDHIMVKKPRFTEHIAEYRKLDCLTKRTVLTENSYKMKKQPTRKGFEYPHETVIDKKEKESMFLLLAHDFDKDYHKYRKLYNHIAEANKLLPRCDEGD